MEADGNMPRRFKNKDFYKFNNPGTVPSNYQLVDQEAAGRGVVMPIPGTFMPMTGKTAYMKTIALYDDRPHHKVCTLFLCRASSLKPSQSFHMYVI